ncbi:hypothetical protein J6590_094964 [Homalodisca vitripennis]|nr:hypothetical protein J6590_094964 [Homalodisca vitripennis]
MNKYSQVYIEHRLRQWRGERKGGSGHSTTFVAVQIRPVGIIRVHCRHRKIKYCATYECYEVKDKISTIGDPNVMGVLYSSSHYFWPSPSSLVIVQVRTSYSEITG